MNPPTDIPADDLVATTATRRRPSSRQIRWSTAVIATALAGASSCGGSTDTPTADTSSPPSVEDVTGSTAPDAGSAPTVVVPSSDVPEPSGPPDTHVGEPAPATCLDGEWTVSESELNDYFDAVAATSGFGSIESAGDVRVSFDDTTYRWSNDFVVNLSVAGTEYRAELAGEMTGTYETNGQTLSGTIDEDHRVGRFTQGDRVVEDAGDLFVGVVPSRPLDAARFSCAGPTLMIESGPNPDARHSLTLTPAQAERG